MPYVGTGLNFGGFTATIKDSFTGNNSDTDFTLSRAPSNAFDIEVFVGNVRQEPNVAYTVSGTTLAFTGTPASGEVIYAVHQAGGGLTTVLPQSFLGVKDYTIGGSLNLNVDNSSALKFGADQDVTMTHVADSGLILKNTSTADDTPFVLSLQTGETDIAANDVLGSIRFQAPDEGTGTDALLVAAAIDAISEGDFSSSSNASKLSFRTGASETATEKMSLSSGGNLSLPTDATVVSLGADADVTLTHVHDTGILLNGSSKIQFTDAAESIHSDGSKLILTSNSVAFSLPTADGSSGQVLQTNGSGVLSFASSSSNTPSSADGQALGSASLEWSDLFLADGGQILFGNDQEITLSHNADNGLILKHVGTGDGKEPSLTFQAGDNDIAANDVLGSIFFQAPDEGAGTDAILIAAGIEAVSEGDFSASNNATKLSFLTAASELASEKMSLSSAGVLTTTSNIVSGGNIVIPDSGNIGSASDTDAISIASNGQLTLTQTLIGTALDISGDIDVDGTTNLDVVDIDGAVDMASTLQVDGAITSSTGATITTADNTVQLTLTSTDADANSGPILDLVRDSGSPADGDEVGIIRFKFDDDAGEVNTAARFTAKINDASNGTEDGELEIVTLINGSSRSRIEMLPTETVINEDSVDLDFRVESDSQMASFFVEGSTSNIGIGHNTPTADSALAGLSVPAGTKYVHVHDTDGAVLKLSDPADGSNRGAQFGIIGTAAVLNNCESGDMRFGTGNTERMRILAAGGLTFNGDTAAANALDDYEEGTWTAAYGSGGSNTGRYTRIGRLVFVNVILNNTSKSFDTITGLPYAASGSTGGGLYSGSIGRIIGMGESRETVGIGATASYIQLHDDTGGANTLTSGSGTVRFDISVTYETDA